MAPSPLVVVVVVVVTTVVATTAGGESVSSSAAASPWPGTDLRMAVEDVVMTAGFSFDEGVVGVSCVRGVIDLNGLEGVPGCTLCLLKLSGLSAEICSRADCSE